VSAGYFPNAISDAGDELFIASGSDVLIFDREGSVQRVSTHHEITFLEPSANHRRLLVGTYRDDDDGGCKGDGRIIERILVVERTNGVVTFQRDQYVDYEHGLRWLPGSSDQIVLEGTMVDAHERLVRVRETIDIRSGATTARVMTTIRPRPHHEPPYTTIVVTGFASKQSR
jgi:hypothetical protein